MTAMVELVGEQAIPNLLPVKHLTPECLVLVHTDRTKSIAERLRDTLKDTPQTEVDLLDAEPYNVTSVEKQLRDFIDGKDWQPRDLVFNITGGTKPMSIAAWDLARDLHAQCVYLQSEGGRSLLYTYSFPNGNTEPSGEPTEIPPLIKLDEYLRAQVGEYGRKQRLDPVEQRRLENLCDCLRDKVEEVEASLSYGANTELDVIIRIGNQVGVAEVKTGNKADKKRAIEQLMSLGQREHLGTYTRKFLILDRPLESNNAELADFLQIRPIVIPSIARETISTEDSALLVSEIRSAMAGSA